MLLGVFIQIAILLLSVVCHEYAHGWVAFRFGDRTAKDMGRLTLNPLKHIDPLGMVIFPLMLKLLNLPILGWAKPVPVNFHNLRNPKKDMIWVAAAGPLTNFSLAVLAAGLLHLTEVEILGWILQNVIVLNLVLATFNLIPIPPLDGGRVAVGLLPYPWAFRYAQIEPFGFVLIFLLMYTRLLDFYWVIPEYLATILIGGIF